MKSRRGRELIPQLEQKIQPKLNTFEHYHHKSAIHLLDEFIAAYTPDRAPIGLVEARNALHATNDISKLSSFQQSPYKIVRDAAEDKIRALNGQPPQIQSSGYDPRWGQIADGRIAPQIMAPAGHFESRHFSFDPHSHGLGRVPGRLAGHVNESYPRFAHHLQARVLNNEVVVQAQSEKPQYPENHNFPLDQGVEDEH